MIVGISGLIGSHLALAFRQSRQVYGTYRTRHPKLSGTVCFQVDLSDQGKLVERIRKTRPDILYYCAGVSDEEFCQNHRPLAELVHCRTAVLCAELLDELGGSMVYFSSSKVFSGAKGTYSEEDTPDPISLYGGLKLQAEHELERLKNVTILRLGNVFGLGVRSDSSGLSRLLSRLWSGHRVPLISDEYRSFYSVDEVVSVCESLMENKEGFPTGVFHLSNCERSSYFDLGHLIVHLLDIPEKAVSALTGEEFDRLQGVKWPRGQDLTLDGSRLNSITGREIASIRIGLASLRRQLRRGGW